MAITNGIAGKRKDWDIYNHATWIFTFRLFGFDGNPINASTAILSGSIRKDQDQASQQYLAFDAPSFSISGTDNSYVTVSKVVSIAQSVLQAYYDIKAELPGGIVVFPVYGFVDVNNQRP